LIVKPGTVLSALQDQARRRPLVDFEATRRALSERETKIQYKDWVNVGSVGAPTFGPNWSNVDMATISAFEPLTSDGRNPAGYFRDRWGFVHIRGVVTNPTGIVSTVIFQLPSDLAPSGKEHFKSAFVTNGTGGLSGTAFRYACEIEVDTLGNVLVSNFFTTTGTGGIRLLLLENIQFHAADRGAVS
jgi:hypothetical protein